MKSLSLYRHSIPLCLIAFLIVPSAQAAVEDDEAAQVATVSSNYTTPSPFEWNLDEDSTATSDFDRVVSNKSNNKLTVAGTLNVILGSNVDLSDGFWDDDRQWTVFSGFNGGEGNNGSNFTAITQPAGLSTVRPGASFSGSPSSNGSWTLTYNSASFVPEPSSAIVGGLIGLGFLRRRRG